ncbi:hypothetical protein [Dyella japonica]|uniref:Transcriptional regulator with XRE-family HTH domain n=1 Tax=Dyella japonica TaxID=231455 RepID=A0ABV2JUJ5_9GAMM
MNPQEAVLALIAARWSESRIGRVTGISQSTINRLKNGTRSVKYEQGVALVSLARTVSDGLDGAAAPENNQEVAA